MYSSPMERIMKEYQDLNRFPLSQFGLSIGLVNNNDYTRWRFTLMAPNDSLYKGGYFNWDEYRVNIIFTIACKY